jgi:hypothetical protein
MPSEKEIISDRPCAWPSLGDNDLKGFFLQEGRCFFENFRMS